MILLRNEMRLILQQCTLYVTIQHMISNYDIEARQLSIDKQRQ